MPSLSKHSQSESGNSSIPGVKKKLRLFPQRLIADDEANAPAVPAISANSMKNRPIFYGDERTIENMLLLVEVINLPDKEQN